LCLSRLHLARHILLPYTTLFRSRRRGGEGSMIDYSSPDFWPDLFDVMLTGTLETLWMTGVAILFTIIVGLPLGIVLVGTEKGRLDRKSTRLNSSHVKISYAVFCL